MERVALIATVLTAVGSGLMGGFFYAFSGTVMGALGRLSSPHAISAMQAINATVLHPLFFALFFGTAATSLLLLVVWLFGSGSALAAASALFYLGGVLLVTLAANVPLNNALAAFTPDNPGGPSAWADYHRRWTLWNHVRTLSGTGALALALAELLRAPT